MEQSTPIYKARKATVEDTDLLVEMIITAFNKGESWTDETKYVTSKRTNPEMTRRDIEYPKTAKFIIEDMNNKPIATVQATVMDGIFWLDKTKDPYKGETIVCILLLAVNPEVQSKGLGTITMNFIDKYVETCKRYAESEDKSKIDNNIMGIYNIDFENDPFIKNCLEDFKTIKKIMVSFNSEREALQKFYYKLGYRDIGFSYPCSELDKYGITYVKDFDWNIYDKLIIN